MELTQEELLAQMPHYPISDINASFMRFARDAAMLAYRRYSGRLKDVQDIARGLTNLEAALPKHREIVLKNMLDQGELNAGEFSCHYNKALGQILPGEVTAGEACVYVPPENFTVVNIVDVEFADVRNNFGVIMEYEGPRPLVRMPHSLRLGYVNDRFYFGEFTDKNHTLLVTEVHNASATIRHRVFHHKSLDDTDVKRDKSDVFNHMAVRAWCLHSLLPKE